MTERIPTRPRCARCQQYIVIDTDADDDLWREVIGEKHGPGYICADCFARAADERLIDWSHGLRLRPLPLVNQLAFERAAAMVQEEGVGEDGWRPFETAPEDGTEILAYRPDAGVFTAHYVEEDAHLSSVMSPPEGDCYWFTTGGEDLTGDLPTHWRPLPSAPGASHLEASPPSLGVEELREAAAHLLEVGQFVREDDTESAVRRLSEALSRSASTPQSEDRP